LLIFRRGCTRVKVKNPEHPAMRRAEAHSETKKAADTREGIGG
jgi:hypothetical protein